MNVEDILAQVAYELSHDPDNDTERRNRIATLSTLYRQLLDEKRWDFLERLSDLYSYPWLVITDTFTVSGKSFTAATAGTLPSAYLGAEVRCDDFDDGTYYVARIDGSTWWLDADPGATTGSLVLTIRPRTTVPVDCSEMLGVMSRDDDRGPLGRVTLAEEHRLMLNDDETSGTPYAYVTDPPTRIPRGPGVALAASQTTGGTGGALATSTEYAFFYAFYERGVLSGRSPVVRITTSGTTGATARIALTGLEDWSAATRGVERWLYVDPANAGRFQRFSAQTAMAPGTVYYNAAETLGPDWRDTSTIEAIRFYPRPASITYTNAALSSTAIEAARKRYELRYKLDVEPLVALGDTPEMPDRFHPLLVHRLCERLAMKREDDSMAKFHRRAGDVLLGHMQRRHLVRRDHAAQFGMWTDGGGRVGSRPTITKA